MTTGQVWYIMGVYAGTGIVIAAGMFLLGMGQDLWLWLRTRVTQNSRRALSKSHEQ